MLAIVPEEISGKQERSPGITSSSQLLEVAALVKDP
jgi:hypothetical protein